ncbi:MAG: ABC transporter ATP-binding protein [Eubacterium sp.]
MKQTILSTEKLCKTFSNSGVQQHILKNLDLEIEAGAFTVIMGSSGAGKSTLLYALSGMDKPTLGKIYCAGQEISGYSNDALAVFRRQHCGFVFQQIYLLDNMSVFDNILAAGYLLSGDRKAILKRCRLLFEEVGLPETLLSKFPSQISGGEAQRVGIVRALINDPDIVFADEPTGALNSGTSTAVLDVLTQVNNRGQSIVMVTHDLKSALRGSQILYLRDGVVCGTCHLGTYTKEDTSRHERLNAFLAEMGW